MEDVATTMMGEFAKRLETEIDRGHAQLAASAADGGEPADAATLGRVGPRRRAEALDLGNVLSTRRMVRYGRRARGRAPGGGSRLAPGPPRASSPSTLNLRPLKPPRFEYHDPATVDEALALLAEHGDEGKVLAGGQSLVPLLNFRLAHPEHLIDLNRHRRAVRHQPRGRAGCGSAR